MYYFKYNKSLIYSFLLEKNNILHSLFFFNSFQLCVSLFFFFKFTLKAKLLKFALVKKLFFYSRLLEQVAAQRFLFKVVSYRWGLPFYDLLIDNLDSKKEIIYGLFSNLKNNELVIFVYFKQYILKNSFFLRKLNFFNLKTKKMYKVTQFFKLGSFIKSKNTVLKKLYRQRIYNDYIFLKPERYNHFLVNLLDYF